MRLRLEDTRNSIVHHFKVQEIEGFLNVGLYDDGTPGELFITISKEGSTLSGVMDSLAATVSLALQYGVPLSAIVRKLSYQRFEPSGHVSNENIGFATSIVDYIFRWLGYSFIPEYEKQDKEAKSLTSLSVPSR